MSEPRVCLNCGTVMEMGIVARPCEKCGAKKWMTKTKYDDAKARHDAHYNSMKSLGLEPVENKAVGVSIPLLGESQNADKVTRIMNEMTGEGWQFLFAFDSPRLIDGPVMIFQRRMSEEFKPG